MIRFREPQRIGLKILDVKGKIMSKSILVVLIGVVFAVPAWAAVTDMDPNAYRLERQRIRERRPPAQSQVSPAAPQPVQGQAVKGKPAAAKAHPQEQKAEMLTPQQPPVEPEVKAPSPEQDQLAVQELKNGPTNQELKLEPEAVVPPVQQEQPAEPKVENQLIPQEQLGDSNTGMGNINAVVPEPTEESTKQ
jgi:hypothetical protein